MIAGAILAVVAALIIIVLVRALMLKPTSAANAVVELDNSERAVIYGDKLAKMVRVETISEPKQADRSKFLEFHKVLEEEFQNEKSKMLEKNEKIEYNMEENTEEEEDDEVNEI